MDKIRINLHDLLVCISNAQDLVSAVLANHHQQVAYLAFRLSEQINLPVEQQKDIFLASLVHDIGVLSKRERLELIETEPITVNHHAFKGAKMIEGFKPLKNSARIIKFHHIPWNNGQGRKHIGEDVPLSSHIIHLADRTCALIRSNRNIITQLPDILSSIRSRVNTIFMPELVNALFELSPKEYIWLDIVSQFPMKMITNVDLFNTVSLGIDDIIDLALVFSRIIDFRSRFTACHSAGVAKTAEKLAQLMGFSAYECKMMLVAGYLHDLGKIAIDDEILEKPAKLNKEEFNIMRSHAYYTFRLLEPMVQLKTINAWASFHHEKLDGNGYPFHISGDSLSLGSRIMAVADVFTAITENRPYRKGMDTADAKKVLKQMVQGNALDGEVVDLLLDNYKQINGIRENTQFEAALYYSDFMLDKRIYA